MRRELDAVDRGCGLGCHEALGEILEHALAIALGRGTEAAAARGREHEALVRREPQVRGLRRQGTRRAVDADHVLLAGESVASALAAAGRQHDAVVAHGELRVLQHADPRLDPEPPRHRPAPPESGSSR